MLEVEARRVRAILVYASDYENPGLERIPGARFNVERLRAALSAPELWGVPEERVTVIEATDSNDTLNAIADVVENLEVDDFLLFYYAGHGLLDDGDYYLATRRSRPDRAAFGSLQGKQLRSLIDGAGTDALSIIDACYSARIVDMGDQAQRFAEQIRGPRISTWVACGGSESAKAPLEAEHTAFTGALLHVLYEGIAGAEERLTVAQLQRAVKARITRLNAGRRKDELIPMPRSLSGTDLDEELVLVRNRAHVATSSVNVDGAADSITPVLPELVVSHEDGFRIGPLSSPISIIDGDGAHPILESNVTVTVLDRQIQLTGELAAWRAEIAEEQDRKRAAGENAFWNNPRYAVERVVVDRDDEERYSRIQLQLSRSDYYNFRATQRLDTPLRDGTTLRSRFLDGRHHDDVPAFMRNSFGVNVAVVTSDSRVVIARRAGTIGSQPGLWNSSVNEGLSRSLDAVGRREPNLFDVVRRGMREELGVFGDYDLRMLAVFVDTRNCQWGAYFVAYMDVDWSTLSQIMSRDIQDRFENTEFKAVPFTPESVLAFMLDQRQRDQWTTIAPPLFYLALVNRYGVGAVGRAFATAVARTA
ncbi:caspase, EACC1-associated type [Stackebrandtia soli]|uniref:caspase, EACC1-associated type n=1 Tax=Stackebrandtia soli TaxID=1892856 RepID=UPI0039E85620